MNWPTLPRTVPSLGAFLVLLLAAGCGGREQAAREAAVAVPVRVETVSPVRESAFIDAVGSIRAAREAVVASKVMGTVMEIRRHAGDLVHQGETLLVIDGRDLSGQIAQGEGALAQARAAEVLAETGFHRVSDLFARGSASQLELDQARYQYDTARGAVEQAEGALSAAKSYLSYAEIAAPFTGRVVDQLCEVGELAAPGRPLMKLEDPSRLRLFASMDEAEADAAVVGAAVTVRIPSLGDRVVTGSLAEVVPAADPATHSILIKVDLAPDAMLRSGLFAHAQLARGWRQVLRVPRSAVVERGGLTEVFLAESGQAALRMVVLAGEPDPVGTGAADALGPEVISGLAAGERVIVSPPAQLEVGSPLEVRS